MEFELVIEPPEILKADLLPANQSRGLFECPSPRIAENHQSLPCSSFPRVAKSGVFRRTEEAVQYISVNYSQHLCTTLTCNCWKGRLRNCWDRQEHHSRPLLPGDLAPPSVPLMASLTNATSFVSPLANADYKVPLSLSDGFLNRIAEQCNGWTIVLTLILLAISYDQCSYKLQKHGIIGPDWKIPFMGPFLESVYPDFEKYKAKWASGELSCVSVFHKYVSICVSTNTANKVIDSSCSLALETCPGRSSTLLLS